MNNTTPDFESQLPAWFAELLEDAALPETDESVQASAIAEHAAQNANGSRG